MAPININAAQQLGIYNSCDTDRPSSILTEEQPPPEREVSSFKLHTPSKEDHADESLQCSPIEDLAAEQLRRYTSQHLSIDYLIKSGVEPAGGQGLSSERLCERSKTPHL